MRAPGSKLPLTRLVPSARDSTPHAPSSEGSTGTEERFTASQRNRRHEPNIDHAGCISTARPILGEPSSRGATVTGSHARREKPSRYAFSTRAIEFDGRRGRLFTPDSADHPPVVIIAPGAGLRWRPTLESTAERFASRGYAAFAFDYRGFGDGNEDRLVSPARQRADLDAAVETALESPEVNGDRLAVWGMDLSAGTAVAAAADSFRINAVIARFPVVNGTHLLPSWIRPRIRGLARGIADYPVSTVDRLRSAPNDDQGLRVPLFGEPGETAAIAAPGAARGARDVLGRDPGTTPARSLVNLRRHDLRERIEELTCPALFVAGERDEVAPPKRVASLSESAPTASLFRVPAAHYSALTGSEMERILNHEIAFLDAEL